MVHLSTASAERFSSLAPDPAADLERLRHNLGRGTVRPEHLLVVSDGGADIARVGLFTHPDGTTVTYAYRVDVDHPDVERVYTALLDGVAEAARATGTARVFATVLDADDPAPQQKRAALLAGGWEVDGDRLELEAHPTAPAPAADPAGVVEVDPGDPEVVAVMAAAMADSCDDYDREQVAALGAQAAAAAYRDMMVDGRPGPWLAHRAQEGLDGVSAVMRFPEDWCLGYLGVAPAARRRGVGATLAGAMLSATARAGVDTATASVAVANIPIRQTLARVGFTVRSPRTDFVLRTGS